MKKIILVFSLLYSILGFGKVNIDEVYSNAKLNIDFSSSMVFSDKQNVIEKELAEWILSNPNRFEDVNQIKIAYEPKWYWGSWKKVVRGLEFVKKENVKKRIAYYEDLRKRNEEEFRRQQERKTFLTALGFAAASYLGVKIYENRYEIGNFIKENWNSGSSKYSNENNNSKQKTDKENNNETLKNSESVKIDKEKYRTGNFELPNYTEEVAYSEKYVTKIFIKFIDNISFAIYYNPECGKYYHTEMLGIKSYYKDKISLIKSMYASKKGEFNNIYNFGNSSTCD